MSHGEVASVNGKSNENGQTPALTAMSEKSPAPARELSEKLLPRPPPDGGWGWVVVFAAFMIHIIIDGLTYSFGIFFDEFLSYFHESKFKTSWIASLLTGFTLCSGPIVSWSMNRWGCKLVAVGGALLAFICMSLSAFANNVLTLIFTVGVGTGFGCGFMYLPAIVSVSIWFERRRSLATGMAVCGAGLGMFIFPPMTKFLISTYGWRTAMAIIGSLNLIGVPLGLTLRPVPELPPTPELIRKSSLERSHNTELRAPPNGDVEDSDVARLTLSQPALSNLHDEDQLPSSIKSTQFKTKDEKQKCGWLSCCEKYKSALKEMFDPTLLMDPIYILFCISNFVTNIGYYIPIFYTQNMSKGLDISNPEYLMSIVGVGSLCGRTLLGYITDKPWVNRLMVYNFCLIIAGISTGWAAMCTEFWGLAMFAVTFGFTSGAYVALTPVVLVDLFGVDKVSNALGSLLLVLGVSSLIGPPLLGRVYDVTQSYPLVYYVAGALIVLSGMIPFLIPLLKRRAARARTEEELPLEQI